MSDPLTGGAAKVAEEMLKEVQAAAEQAAEQAQKAQGTGDAQFQQTLQDVSRVQETQETGPLSAVDRLREAIQSQRTTPAVPAAGQTLDSRPVTAGIQRVFEGVMSGQNKLESIIELSLSGKNFSQSELLALQAGVYRFTQELELTSKVIEKGTASIKQTLNTQV